MFKIQSPSVVSLSINRPVGLIPFVSTTENTQGLARKPIGNIILSSPVYEAVSVEKSPTEISYGAVKWGRQGT